MNFTLAVGTGLNLPLYSERVPHLLDSDLLRDPRPLVTDTGFETTEADQAGVAGLVHHVQARRPTSTTRSR